jgi:hypothetical protein
MHGYRPSSGQGLVLIPKNNGNVLKTTEGATANYGGNTKFGLYPNVGMNYLFRNKIGVGSLFYDTTTPSQVNPPQAASTDGPGIQTVLPLAASEYVGPEGTFTFTAGTYKVDGDDAGITDYVGFAYLWGHNEPDIFGDPLGITAGIDNYYATNFYGGNANPPGAEYASSVDNTNFPFGSVSGNRKILNGQAEIARIVTDDDDGPGRDDILISIFSDQLNEAQLRSATSTLNIVITDNGVDTTFPVVGAAQNAGGSGGFLGDLTPPTNYFPVSSGGGVLMLTNYNSIPQITFVEGQQYSVKIN